MGESIHQKNNFDRNNKCESRLREGEFMTLISVARITWKYENKWN